jgi:hypothetical protein
MRVRLTFLAQSAETKELQHQDKLGRRVAACCDCLLCGRSDPALSTNGEKERAVAVRCTT